ncbi:MAG: cysteine--tRNA ligase [Bacteriovoracales bacterium]|nr:cysteine--tRNA ligase [Bacteriovoracales bacterium]
MYNTLSSRIEDFVPVEDGKVKMYVCGPTVYNDLHIGNFRGPIFFNFVRNWLEMSGYEVTYVFNYTDVDDKIIERACKEGVDSKEISERYIRAFVRDFDRLGLRDHDHRPKVTDFMDAIVNFIEDLVERKMAYVACGQVFYAIDRFPGYGKLSGKKLEDLVAGQRVEVNENKKNPGDFVLWKPAEVDGPGWDSPWGRGRPGWHIECSTMIREILGEETIDIHGGAVDLIFPHHENEIAQGEGRTGCPYCKLWMHHAYINMNDEKMSKSKGNIIKACDFMDRYHPEIFKYLVLSVHYRSLLNVGTDKVMDAMAALDRIYRSLETAREKALEAGEGEGESEKKVHGDLARAMEEADRKIPKALNDDFNTGAMMASLFEVVRVFNALYSGGKKIWGNFSRGASAKAYGDWMGKWGRPLALFGEEPRDLLERFQEILLTEKGLDRKRVEELVRRRREARAVKDWSKADSLRDELAKMGIELTDDVRGREWKVALR